MVGNRRFLRRRARLRVCQGGRTSPNFGVGVAMGQAIVDPAELRRFAGSLRTFSEEVMAHMQMVQRQLAVLGSTWRDQEQAKFAEEFEAQLSTFKRFAESTSEYVPYLIRKAERVEEYLQQR
jgi:uncharacterized protein YukE